MSSFALLLIFTLTIIHQTFADDVITCTFSATKNHDFGGTLTLSKNGDGNLAVTGTVKNNAAGNWKPNQTHSVALFKNPTDDNQDCSIIGGLLNVVAVSSTNGTADNSTVAVVDNNNGAGDWLALTDVNGDLVVNVVDHFAFTIPGFSDASDFCNHTIAIFNGTDDAASSVVVACCTVAKAVAAAPTEAVLTGVVYETQNQYNHWQNQYGYPWGWNPPYGCVPPAWWNYTLYYTAATTVKKTTSQYYLYTSTAPPTAAPTPPAQYPPGYPAGYYPPPTTTTAKPTTVTTYAYINCYYTCDTYPYETCQQVSAPTCVPSYYVKCSAPNQAVLAALAVLVGLLALFL